MDSRVAKGGRL